MLGRVTGLVFLVLMLSVGTNVAAQTADTDITDVEGLESAYARIFMPDLAAALESDEDIQLLMLSIVVMTFDNARNAVEASDQYSEKLDAAENVKIAKVKDLGDRAMHVTASLEDASVQELFIQDGPMVISILFTGEGTDAENQQMRDIAQFVLDRTPGKDDILFDESGASTGGVFDMMPTSEDADLIWGLIPLMDVDLLSEEADLSSELPDG